MVAEMTPGPLPPDRHPAFLLKVAGIHPDKRGMRCAYVHAEGR